MVDILTEKLHKIVFWLKNENFEKSAPFTPFLPVLLKNCPVITFFDVELEASIEMG